MVRAVALCCGDPGAAEDVVQEALGRAWVRLERGEDFRALDPEIGNRELHLLVTDGGGERTVAALLPDGVATVVVDVGGIHAWQQVRGRQFAVLRVGAPIDPDAQVRVLGFDADGLPLFEEPLD